MEQDARTRPGLGKSALGSRVGTVVAALGGLAVVALSFTNVTVNRPAAPATPPSAKLADLQGRWVQTGNPCDTLRGDMVIDADSITTHAAGEQTSKMHIDGVVMASAGALTLKFESFNHVFVQTVGFQVTDPTLIKLSTPYLMLEHDSVWRKYLS